ncbi:hypothetical protein B0H13DRAFT_2359926 [Mycena leptocephala]|nr:hypothetical protein B0H13DRAFT_2359926 [Mycena leptocephala]
MSDTRVYSTPRLHSFHGYEAPPLVDDGFVWKLPNGGRYFGREVQSGGKRYELWSPNSLQTSYFPGVRPRASRLVIGSTKAQRRADGQLGRFDPTVSAQSFDTRRPWLAFLPSPRVEVDDEDAAYTLVLESWESEADSGFRGRLNPFFVQRLVDANSKADEAMESRSRVRHSRPLLWSDRPQEPWRTSVEALKSVQRFEDAVDLVREAQRGILEKRAWVKMAAAWIQEGGSLETLKKGVVVPANDDFMGAWIHEITELDLYFLLTKAAVPCFFVHELTDGEPPSELVATDFVKWTAVAPRLDPEYCPYNRLVASSANGQFTALEESLVTVGIPDRTHEDRLRSSGRWQFGLHVPDQLPACRFLFEDGRPRSQSVVSVEDARESSVLSLGPEDEEMEDVQVVEPPVVEPPSPNKKATVNVRPQVFAATLTYPSLESTVLTPFLKFPDLNDVFTPNDVRTWLDGANRKVPGCGWRRVLRVARKPRVDYYVEFESAEAALKIRGLIEPREGEIREGYFVGETEFKKIAALSPAVLQQTRNAAETAPASEPYAGGRYLREEPPVTSSLLKTTRAPAIIPPASGLLSPNLLPGATALSATLSPIALPTTFRWSQHFAPSPFTFTAVVITCAAFPTAFGLDLRKGSPGVRSLSLPATIAFPLSSAGL